MKNGSINKKMLRGLLILGAAVIIASGILICTQARRAYVDRMRDQAYSYSGMCAKAIDGDRISGYLESLEKDEYYDTIQKVIEASVEETEIIELSVYIPVPEDGQVLYIWYANNQGSGLPPEAAEEDPSEENASLPAPDQYTGMLTLGMIGGYLPGEKEALESIYASGYEEQFFIVNDPGFGEVVIAMSPVFDSQGQLAAIVEAYLSMNDLNSSIASVAGGLILLLLLTISALIVYQMYMVRTIVSPINKLSEAAGDLVDNLKSGQPFRSDVHTGDEIEVLADSFEKMDSELRTYITENESIVAEKERMGTELALAARIQAGMLPVDFPAFPQVDMFASMRPAKEVGGDFYDFFLIDDTHLGLVIADVSGKGIPASLFMMRSMILIRNIARDGLSPKAVLSEVNEELCRSNEEKMFVTVWFGILDLESGSIIAANGGHEYPVIKTLNGVYEVLKDKHGLVLGGMDGISYSEYELKMEPGSSLFVYTDGVTEATDKNEQLFGMDRLVLALNKDPQADPRQVLANMDAAIADFVKEEPQFDDITMMCVQFKGKPVPGDAAE